MPENSTKKSCVPFFSRGEKLETSSIKGNCALSISAVFYLFTDLTKRKRFMRAMGWKKCFFWRGSIILRKNQVYSERKHKPLHYCAASLSMPFLFVLYFPFLEELQRKAFFWWLTGRLPLWSTVPHASSRRISSLNAFFSSSPSFTCPREMCTGTLDRCFIPFASFTVFPHSLSSHKSVRRTYIPCQPKTSEAYPYCVFVSRRTLFTYPGGFEEPLPSSLGRRASDKDDGRGLSTVNTKKKRVLRRLRQREKLLVPFAPSSLPSTSAAAEGKERKGLVDQHERSASRPFSANRCNNAVATSSTESCASSSSVFFSPRDHKDEPYPRNEEVVDGWKAGEDQKKGTNRDLCSLVLPHEKKKMCHEEKTHTAGHSEDAFEALRVEAMNLQRVVERERFYDHLYTVSPRTTVFGSDLDRLEEDYRRELGQSFAGSVDHVRTLSRASEDSPSCLSSRAPSSALHSCRPLKSPPFAGDGAKGKDGSADRSVFSVYGGGAAGRRARWEPSSSFDRLHSDEGDATVWGSANGKVPKEMSSEHPYAYGTLAEQRQRVKRDPRLTVGRSSSNQYLSAHMMVATALQQQEDANGDSFTFPTSSASSSAFSPVMPMKKDHTVQLLLTEEDNVTWSSCCDSSSPSFPLQKEELSEEGNGETDQPASANPHFSCDTFSVDAGDGLPVYTFRNHREGSASGRPKWEGEDTEERDAINEKDMTPSWIPSSIRVDGRRKPPLNESFPEQRTYGSCVSSSLMPMRHEGGTAHFLSSGVPTNEGEKNILGKEEKRKLVYNAYCPRPWEECIPAWRQANYWETHSEDRRQLEAQLDYEGKLFQQERFAEGPADTAEVEYSIHKLRKEMLLYHQAHPRNEMITESIVRIREIYPVVMPMDASSSSAGNPSGASFGEVLRYHPEALLYPGDWIQKHLLPEEEASGGVERVDGTTRSSNFLQTPPLDTSSSSSVPRSEEETTSLPYRSSVSPSPTNEGMEVPGENSESSAFSMHLNPFAPSTAAADRENSKKNVDTSSEDSLSTTSRALIRVDSFSSSCKEYSSTQRYNDSLKKAVLYLYRDQDVLLSEACRIASDLHVDLIRVGSFFTTRTDRRIIALCALGNHREHAREMIRFKLQKLGLPPPPTKACIEVPFKGGTHPHAIRVKAVGIAKRLLHRHVVRIQLTKFGTPREGFAVLQTILDEVMQQCTSVHAHHTAGRIQSNYQEIYCYLYPSTGKSPKASITHPSPEMVREARDLRLLADEKEINFDDYYNLPTLKARMQYEKKLADGTAWTEKDDGLSLQRQRAIKVMLGYLPKGNKEMYAARGDVNIPAPFRTSHPTGTDRWNSPPPLDNLEQASRGAAVLGKRAGLPVSTMHDSQETEDQPSTLDRFYYRVQGSALEVGELKEALGLKDNRRRGVPLAPGFATLNTTEKGKKEMRNRSTEDPPAAAH